MNTTRQILSLSLLLTLASISRAQTLRGSLRDADNGDAVVGATVTIQFSRSGATPLSLASNLEGEFIFEKVRAGYYTLEISAQGFESQTIAEVYVTAGKEQVLDIALRRATAQLAEVTILSDRPGRRPTLPLGEIPLTRDQTLRFPAMYFDPVRLAAAYPGVLQADDGTNVISIRGNSPSSVRWRLEGVDIVNPNHLPNAGTFSDRPAAASGGTLMFSAQLLDNASMLVGPMPAGYGDALGGVMDINLRHGNNRQHEFTAQAGLIGLDVAAEGPLGRKGKNAYLVNYRYSTVGLLGELGVSFGDEQINFQDLSFNFHFEGKRGGHWSVFGLGGLSENIFRHKTDSAEIKAYKDFFDIDFESKTGVLGITNWTPLGKKAWIKTSVAYSEQKNDRNSKTDRFLNQSAYDHISESKLSAAVTCAQRIGRRARWMVGLFSTREDYSSLSGIQDPIVDIYPLEPNYLLLQPWTQFSWKSRNQKSTTVLGLHGVILAPGNDQVAEKSSSVEPRFSFSRKLAERHRISFAAGLYSQVPSAWVLGHYSELLRSKKVELAYAWNFATVWQVKIALYKQWLDNAPYFIHERFGLLNTSEYSYGRDFSSYNVGKGSNKGVELSVERNLINGWFLLLNGSLFDSQYSTTSSPEKGDWLPTRWNYGHLTNATFGKEWQREKRPGKERTIGLNVRTVWTGGIREAEINYPASVVAKTTVINEDFGYTRQYPDYFRVDIRVYWRKNLDNRRNSTFALDIQNLTAQENLAYHYYDPYTGRIENKFQLGPIPNFSWRLEF